jgi:hypothetical protein
MNKQSLIVAAIVGSLSGVAAVACSSASSTGTTGTTTSTHHTSTSSGNTTTTGSGGATTSSSTGGATTTTTGSGGTTTSTCKSDPSLHTQAGGSIYCGFDADGGNFSCVTGQQCCVGGNLGGNMFAPDECATWGSMCQNPSPTSAQAVPCEQPEDCTANGMSGAICCLMGSTPAQVPGCDAKDLKASGGTGTKCMAATTCGAGNTLLCLQDTDCPTGQTCHAFRWKIIEMGACM